MKRLNLRSVILIVFLINTLLIGFLTVQGADQRVRITLDGFPSSAPRTIQALSKDGILYISAEEFAGLFSYTTFSNDKNKKMIVRAGIRNIKLSPLNPFVMVDDRTYQMALETRLDGDMISIPLAVFLDAVGDQLPDQLVFDQKRRSLSKRHNPNNISAIAIEEKANGTLIRLSTTKDFTEGDVAHFIRREYLYVTLLNGKLDSTQLASEFQTGLIRKIVPFQLENAAQISFMLDRKVHDEKVFVQPGEVLISLRTENEFDADAIQARLDVNKKRWLIDRIIIDPGHGGRDPGAPSPYSKLVEKEVNLDIAQRLKKLIKANLKDVEVLMTRETDKFVPVKDRTKFANAHDGKLFISIHCNANPSKSLRGVSTYILGTRRTEEALAVAEAENSVIELEESSEAYKEMEDAAHILNAIAQSSYLKESEALAQIVNDSISKKANVPNKGVFQAGLYVLMGAAMPRILVETAFISNKYEETLLRRRDFRQKVAEAVFESVKAFKEKSEKGI
ncbi:N-acetylmuramoyl-L-alanine amidase [candidate division KSB1 bacterium]|nr:N-acetylmuramoyl-L-alanine amidase [candidate division KSB1 bacterium]